MDTGTPSLTRNLSTGVVTYGQPTDNGQSTGNPVYGRASYSSTNDTIGLKYQPVRGITLRASRATAFLPPSPLQLTPNPYNNTGNTTATDPRTQLPATFTTNGGGNASLRPQNSRSSNAGIILEPQWGGLRGLRI